jgi:hypothetical protein
MEQVYRIIGTAEIGVTFRQSIQNVFLREMVANIEIECRPLWL